MDSYEYQLTHYDCRKRLCTLRKFFKPAGTLCPLAAKRLCNLVAAGKPLACLAASILAARAIIYFMLVASCLWPHARLEMVKVLMPVCKGTRGACYTRR